MNHLKHLRNYSLIITFIATFFSVKAHSSDNTDRSWESLLRTNKLPLSDQAYCYSDELGKIDGINPDLRVRLASVSKLMTSLWAINLYGTHYKFNTILTISGNNLHIGGSFDPFLGQEKMFFLLSQLNDLGYTKFDTITFDKHLLINPGAQLPSDVYPLITRASNAKNLKIYFNTKTWTEAMIADYQKVAARAPLGKLRKSVEFEIGDAQYTEGNPLEKMEDSRTLTLTSPPLHKYLKEMNVESNNYVAQTLFLKLGGEVQFEKYLKDHFGLSSEKIHFYTGSGLPITINKERKDNYATCSVTLELIASLKYATEDEDLELKDIVAVPGSDAGTFSNRIFPADYKNTFVAKTGTLMHTSTLAGAMNTKKGFNFYGIFNQSTDIVGSKIVQNEMIRTIMTELGGPLAFNYVVVPFQTYEVYSFKSIPSSFMPFEENLF